MNNQKRRIMDHTFTLQKKYLFTFTLKRVITLVCFTLVLVVGQAQQVRVSDLLNMSNFTCRKFDATLRRWGFIMQSITNFNDSSAYVYRSRKPVNVKRQFLRFRFNPNEEELIAFQTDSSEEVRNLKEELISDGFVIYTDKKGREQPDLFQKNNTVVQFTAKTDDSVTVYTCYIQRKKLPKAKDILYAEDLLQLTSHEYLSEVYGAANVRKDIFFLSENKTAPCTV